MLNLTVSSLEKTFHYYQVQSLVLPAFLGQMQVLPGHAESFILLKEGIVVIEKADGEKENLKIKGGECYIKEDYILIIL